MDIMRNPELLREMTDSIFKKREAQFINQLSSK